mgnify:FL=1
MEECSVLIETTKSAEDQQAYKELIPYCGGVEDLLQKLLS